MERDNRTGIYKLDYPNREVEEAMSDYILSALLHKFRGETTMPVFYIKDAFLENDVPKVLKLIHAVFKDVPYMLIRNRKEDFYHTVIHIYFRLLGLIMDSELMTSDGRMDVAVKTPTHIYIIEFKLDESADIAITQIKSKDYAAKYRSPSGLGVKKIVLIGINFDSEKKGVSDWKMEEYN